MTNYEYLKKRTEALGADESDIELILMKGRLIGTDPANIRRCDMAIYKNFSIIRARAVEKIKEGGFAVERSMKAIESFRWSLEDELRIRTPMQKALGSFV